MWKLVVIYVIFLGCALDKIESFNLSPQPNWEAKEPSGQKIFIDKVRSSYFGFSVNLRTDSVMVGAPRAQSTVEVQRKINETGAIYKCPLDLSGNEGPPCYPFVLDGIGDSSQGSSNGYFQSEKKEGQWLGMAMDGKGLSTDKFVVCAPKLITPHTDEHYLLHGICYVTANTTGDKPLERPTKIAPLRRSSLQVHEVNGHRNLLYMYGELGVSVHVSENSEEILIGAPGVYNWKGTVVRYRPRIEDDLGGLSKRDNYQKRAVERPALIEYEVNVPNPNNWNQSDDSYFGFAVTSAYFEGPSSSKLLYAASAPQAAKQVGQIYVFDIVDYSVNVLEEKLIKKYFEATGYQMGEYFGYSILAEDFNGDGYPDIVVGAPYHSEDSIAEHGAVYYYQNLGNFYFDMKTVLRSGSEKGGKFGMCLGRIGDLDLDGFNDLAVGSPFEGNGAIYIFSGGPNGLMSKHVQRILMPESNEFTSPAMFGMSVSRGVDVDGNGYNDIAVGAPNSEAVFVYRSYPVVKIVASLLTDKRELVENIKELQLRVCLQLQSNLGQPNQAKLQLKLKLDTQFSRAHFFDDRKNVRDFEILATNEKKCENFDVALTYKLSDIFKPLDLQLFYTNLNPVPDTKAFCAKCVAVSPNDPTFVTTKLIYRTGCVSDRCVADLRVKSQVSGATINPYVLGSTKTLSIHYTIENAGESAYLPQIRITKSPLLSFNRIPPRCLLEQGTLLCDISKTQIPNGASEELIITLDTTKLDHHEMIISAEAFSAGDEKTPQDNVDTIVIPLAEYSEVETTGSASPTEISTDESGEKVNITHKFEIRNEGPSLIRNAQVHVDIPLKYVDATGRVYTLIDFNRIIVNSRYNERSLAITWTQNDTILIQNPTESTFPVIADEMDALKYDNNRMGLDFDMQPDPSQQEQIQNDQVFRRKRREIEEGVRTYNIYTQKVVTDQEASRRNLRYSTFDDIISNRTLTFDGNDCDTHFCVRMTSDVTNFWPARSVELFVEITVEIDLVQVAKLFNENKDTFLFRMGVDVVKQPEDSRETMTHKMKLPYTVIQTKIIKSTPIWIYIVSSICGLLLLVIVTYVLYRMEFFKRTQREEMARLTRESKLQADETDDE